MLVLHIPSLICNIWHLFLPQLIYFHTWVAVLQQHITSPSWTIKSYDGPKSLNGKFQPEDVKYFSTNMFLFSFGSCLSKSARASIRLIQYKEKKNTSSCALDSLARIWCLCFTFLSCYLIWAADPHIHWFAFVADGTILLYMLVDLFARKKITFPSLQTDLIGIIEAILDKTQGCLLVGPLVSICVCKQQKPSTEPLPVIRQGVRPVVDGKITGNWKWNTARR